MAGPIRQPIDIPSLERYIDSKVPEIKTPIDVKQFGYGQSNPTYLLTDSQKRKYVMRKRPPGKLLSQTAHKVDREYRIIHALANTDVPVPKAYALCEDDSVIGTAFYIMEFLDGRIFDDFAIPGVSASDRQAMWSDAVRTLAKFHSVNPASVGLEKFGKHAGFYNRQLALFNKLTQIQAQARDVETGEPVGPIPHFDVMVKFFTDAATQPKDVATLVHGDYKIDNLVFHKTEPRVIGILDWEMSTIGHPLSDLANLLNQFVTASNKNAEKIGRGPAAFRPGATEGLPTRDQCLQLYGQGVGKEVKPVEMAWSDAFGVYRGAVIMQGIAARYAMRQASSAQAKQYASWMPAYGMVAWDLVQECQRKLDKSKL